MYSWVRWILGGVVVVALLLVGLRLAMSNLSFRRALVTYLGSSELSLMPPSPWYYEPDPQLSKKIKNAIGYSVSAIFQCDVPTCGYRGRFIAITFPAWTDGTVEWKSWRADTLFTVLEEPDLSVPSQADYTAIAMMGVGSQEGGNYLILQLDEGDNERAKAMLNAIIDRWHQAWDKCRAEKRCPPKKER